MVMLLKPKSKETAAAVPDGTYKATLSKVTQFENAYGQRIGFEFTLQGKGVEGERVMRSTTPKPLRPRPDYHLRSAADSQGAAQL
jgi:hypothetical protein